MTAKMLMRRLAVALLCFTGVAVGAQDARLPVPLDAYGQPDPSAVAPRMVSPTDTRALATLEQILQYDPENVSARIQNGFLMIARGQRQRGLDEFGYALRLAGDDEKLRRQVHWNYGWALYRAGDPRAAVNQWMQAEKLHGGRPAWVPTTYAIGLWEAGERELAVQFYRGAVLSNPRRWGESKSLAEAIRDWSPDEKRTIEAVYAAWRETVGQR